MTSPRRPDPPSLVAGVLVAALGVLILLDETGAIDLTFGVVGPVVLAILGAILLARGLSRGA